MTEFKFQIGDVVIHKTAAVSASCLSQTNLPKLGIVLERLTQECHGGLQLHYKCRFGIDGLCPMLCELELVLYSEWLSSLPAEESAVDLLQHAKEAAVVELNYDLAHRIRDVIESTKKTKAT